VGTDPTVVCELFVGLGDVNVLGVDDVDPDEPIRVYVETRQQRPGCGRCGTPAVVKDCPLVELVDLPVFGRPARLVWRKQTQHASNLEMANTDNKRGVQEPYWRDAVRDVVRPYQAGLDILTESLELALHELEASGITTGDVMQGGW